MSIVYDPRAMLQKIAPAAKIKRMLKKDVSLKKAALSFVSGIDFLDKSELTKLALKTVREYQERIARAQAEAGERNAGDPVQKDILDDPRLLVNRVQNAVVWQVHNGIREKYRGQKARWLPSDADEPRPEHQANYGKVYIIGEGIDGVEPGDEPGCKCGVEILTDETQLELD